MPKLNPKQTQFVAEYLIDKNATQAAIRAGYSPKTAGSQAHDLLKKPEIRAAIEAKSQRINDRLEVSVETVRKELARLAFLDPRKFYNEDGSLKEIKDLDDDTAAALAGMEIEKLYEHFGKGAAKNTGTITKIKFADKGHNLERLGRHLKMFTDKIEVSGLDELAEKMSRARRRTA
jgi:phage terminase small subunit